MSFFVSVTEAEQVGTLSELVNIFGKRRYPTTYQFGTFGDMLFLLLG